MRPRHPAAIMIPSFRSSVHDHTTRVSENRDLGGSHFLLTLEAEPIAVSARPGHFVMLRFDGCLDPLLPRPMSVCNVLPPGGGHPGRIQILHKVVGKGTARLSTLKPGERLQVLGPLGRPFETPASGEGGSLAVMVAGGIGVAIFPLLVPQLKRAGYESVLLFGARSSRDLVHRDWFARQGVPVRTATEDGSEGRRGLVTELLGETLASRTSVGPIYACGPRAMLQAVSGVANAAGKPTWLSLESYMGCGIGACLGCVTRVRRERTWAYQRICVEGPTFSSTEVLWE